MSETQRTTEIWSWQGPQRAPSPASHFTDEDAQTWLPYLKCLLYSTHHSHSLPSIVLFSPHHTKYGPEMTNPFLQRRKTEAQRSTESRARLHSTTCLQVQTLPAWLQAFACSCICMHVCACLPRGADIRMWASTHK